MEITFVITPQHLTVLDQHLQEESHVRHGPTLLELPPQELTSSQVCSHDSAAGVRTDWLRTIPQPSHTFTNLIHNNVKIGLPCL